MAGQGFDVSDVILAFISDTTRSSIELPHMTTGLRKQTKKLVEQNPELRCDSFGFGQERQLHIFKKQFDTHVAAAVASIDVASSELPSKTMTCRFPPPANATGGAVSVKLKNTFIDDFAENDVDDAERETRAVSTMPPALSRLLVDFAAGMDGKRDSALPSTVASSNPSTTVSPTGSAKQALFTREQVPLGFAPPPGLEVRNTFIHFGQPADERIVQSMPHGMFGQCLLSDMLSRSAQDAIKASAVAPTAEQWRQPVILPFTSAADEEDGSLAPGTEVVITGLSKLPTFNGLRGTVQSFDETTLRFSILLIEPAGGHKWVKVKRENVAPVAPPPPPLSPSPYAPEVTATLTRHECRTARPLSLTGLV